MSRRAVLLPLLLVAAAAQIPRPPGAGSSSSTPYDARKLQGRNISAASLANGQTLTWNAATQVWEPVTPSAAGGLPTFVDQEIPSGAVNGANTSFTTAFTPLAASVKVYRNGIRQRQPDDCSVTGATVSFVTAPSSGDLLIVEYRR